MAFRFMMMLLAGLAADSALRGQAPEEYQVKAAFLYNFARFVEWPPQAFKTAKDPIAVCVLGENPFGNTLEKMVEGKSAAGRPLVYRNVTNAESACSCQILFVASSEKRHFRSVRPILKSRGILTVGEAEGFAVSDGGVINFKLDEGRVRFEISLDAAEQQQLHISSKLLGLAQIVKPEKQQ
jgi:hypothetical protein